jgi:hypothetical protein
MLPPKRKDGITRVATVGAVVFDVFVAPPAAAPGAKITGKAHAATRDAAYGPSPITFETPSLSFESRFQVLFVLTCRVTVSSQPLSNLASSHHQCGNLWRAVRVGEELYELLMTSDFNKRTKTCWFYFRVEGARKGVRYRFRIINFEKPDSLFKHGQRVLCYSCATEQWFRVGGGSVSYLPNNIHSLHAASYGLTAAADEVAGGGECPQLYTLDFTFESTRDGDTLYFAPCFPYSVRDHAQHLLSLQVSPAAINRTVFCRLPITSLMFRAKNTFKSPACACHRAFCLATSLPSQACHHLLPPSTFAHSQ